MKRNKKILKRHRKGEHDLFVNKNIETDKVSFYDEEKKS